MPPSSWTLSTLASSTQVLPLGTLAASVLAWPSSACCSSPSLAASSTTCTVNEGVSSPSAQVSPTQLCLPLAQLPVWYDFFLLTDYRQAWWSSLSPEYKQSHGGIRLTEAAGSLCCRPADGAVGTAPSFCFRPALALEVCSPAMWDIPLSGQAGQGTLYASLLASGPSHTVLSGGGASHFPALSDPVLLWELGMDPR